MMIAKKAKGSAADATTEPTASQLQAKLEALDEQLNTIDAAIGTYQTEKASLTTAAYVEGDTAARERLDEINLALALQQRRREDIVAARGPLQEQHDATASREMTEAKAARREQLEEQIPKAREAAEASASALIEAAAHHLTPFVDAHRDALGRWSKLQRELVQADEEIWVGTSHGALSLPNVAVAAVRAAGLPELTTPFDIMRERERARVDGAHAFHAGREAGRNEATPTTVDQRLSGEAERRRLIFEAR